MGQVGNVVKFKFGKSKQVNGRSRVKFDVSFETGINAEDKVEITVIISGFIFSSPCVSKKGTILLDHVCLSILGHEMVHFLGYLWCISSCLKKIDKKKPVPLDGAIGKCDKKCTDLWLESMRNPFKQSETLAHWVEKLVFKAFGGCW